MIIPTPQYFDQGMSILKDAVQSLTFGRKIDLAVGGIAGPMDPNKSMLVGKSHLPNWVGKPLKATLEKILNTVVKLDNDAAMGGLGEANFGSGQGYKIVAYLTIGTGVGGARVIGGQLDQSSHGFEPGHQIMALEGGICPTCQKPGHLEGFISGAAIEKKYGKSPEAITDKKIWEELAKYTAIGLNNVIVHWSPDIVILGGSVSNSLPIELVKTFVEDYTTIFPSLPIITKGKLGDAAGLYGAFRLLKN